MSNILAADIGGTNSRFAHFTADRDGLLRLVETLWLDTTRVKSFPELLQKLWDSEFPLKPEEVHAAAFAIAGPVERGGVYSNPPLISWDVDVSEPAKLGLSHAVLVNDFVAQAYACRTEPGEHALEILPGRVDPDGSLGVMGAGTGLGKAILTPDGRGGFLAVPSEGGHAAFPFLSGPEYEYQTFLQKSTGFSYLTGNVVLSGRGLRLLQMFLKGEELSPADVASKEFNDPSSRTLEWFSRFYGRAARNFALEALSVGGLYIAGGIAARNPVILSHPAFEEEFRSSPEHQVLMGRIPVFLVTDEQSGLWGAALRGLLELKEVQ